MNCNNFKKNPKVLKKNAVNYMGYITRSNDMGLVNNFYGVDLSVKKAKFQKDESNRGKDEIINEMACVKRQVPESKPIMASALDVMATITKSEINIKSRDAKSNPAVINEITADKTLSEAPETKVSDNKGRDDLSYDELVFKYYEMCENQATDEELIPILREIIAKWTPGAQGMFGETRSQWQSTLAFRINRAYFADTLTYLEEGGDPESVNFDEIASFEKDLADTYKVPQDKYYLQNRTNVYSALINLYSILLLRPGLTEENRLKLEVKLEDVKDKLEQLQ